MRSIRARLTRTLLRVLVSLLIAGLLMLVVGVWHVLLRAFDSSLRARAEAVAALTEIEGGRLGFDFSDDFLAPYRSPRSHLFFQLRDSAGKVVSKSPNLDPDELAEPHFQSSPNRLTWWNVKLPGGRSGRALAYTFKPVANDKMPFPEALQRLEIIVAADRGQLNETLWSVVVGAMGMGLILTGSIWFVVPKILQSGLRPLEELADATSRVTADSLGTQFDAASLPIELQPIAQRLNDLFVRLERSFERERRFSADLAHELRTPLAELRSIAECAIKWPDTRDEGTDREVLAIAQQMERLVVHILALTRSELGQSATKVEEIEVSDLLTEIWHRHAARAATRDLRVTLALSLIRVKSDGALLASMLNNLCENAVDYTPTGGEILLRTRVQGSRVMVEISNSAPTLNQEDVQNLFDRFWRKEAARSDSKHVGLGLSLARSFAETIGWRLEAKLEDSYLTFKLTAPLEPV